jgi:hypothetical protein
MRITDTKDEVAATLAQWTAAAVFKLGTDLLKSFLPAGALAAPVHPDLTGSTGGQYLRDIDERHLFDTQCLQVLQQAANLERRFQNLSTKSLGHNLLYFPRMVDYSLYDSVNFPPLSKRREG